MRGIRFISFVDAPRCEAFPISVVFAACAVAAVLVGGRSASAELYPLRWFCLSTNFLVPSRADRAVEVVEQAAKAGLNGVIIADAKFGTLDIYDYDRPGHPYRIAVDRFVAACRHNGIEVIPVLPNVSCGAPLLAHNVNLAAGYEVRDAVFEVRGGVARLVPDPDVQLRNGGFEEVRGDRLTGWDWQDGPGIAVLPDREVVRSGQQSIRLEPVGATDHGMCRVRQRVTVKPHRYYRVSVWLRTESLEPEHAFNIMAGAGAGPEQSHLVYAQLPVKSTQSWTRMDVVLNSLDHTQINVGLGLWKSKSGKAWLDDAEITEIGLVNVLRRPGCPLVVRRVDDGEVLMEGRDYAPVFDPALGRARGWTGSYDRYHAAATIRLRKDLLDGTRLLVGYYHVLTTKHHQVDCCMAEDEVHALFERQVRRLDPLVASPNRYLIQLSELRTGGGCVACRSTGRTPGELAAETIHRSVLAIRRVRPEAEILVVHDMFAPTANARAGYWLMQGTMEGSWAGLTPDMLVFNWRFEGRSTTMPFFAGLGCTQVASANVDEHEDREQLFREWLVTMDETPRVRGLVYFTERDDFSDLETFGRMLATHRRAN